MFVNRYNIRMNGGSARLTHCVVDNKSLTYYLIIVICWEHDTFTQCWFTIADGDSTLNQNRVNASISP